MKTIIHAEWIEELKKLLKKDELAKIDNEYSYSFRKDGGKTKIDLELFSVETCREMLKFLTALGESGSHAAKISAKIVWQYLESVENPEKGSGVNKLENLVTAMKAYIGTSEHRWVFERWEDGNMLPWLVTSIEYIAATTFSAASVNIHLSCWHDRDGGGSGRSHERGGGRITYQSADIRKRNMAEILKAKGYYLETKEFVAVYEQERDRALELQARTGCQVLGTGTGRYDGSSWSRRESNVLDKEGLPARMVVDPGKGESRSSVVYCKFWDRNEEVLWKIPYHPVLRVFDLGEHEFYRVHINNLTVYEYDVDVESKLVLPEESKSFIKLLIDHSKAKFSDIVRGKEGGTIVLLEGPPGVGKTLTAEVYSEVMQRPLYRVHSSQLGLEVEEIEKHLQEVLARSVRWGAILLIDEADVFTYERGRDIVQNAIVGVFLRVLEYYRGVLFMTTNRGSNVDDAIVSRLTARFEYEVPDENDQMKLWKILGKQNGIELSDKLAKEIVKKVPGLSGRDIKNVLKLGLLCIREKGNEELTPEVIARVVKFRGTREVH